MPRWVQVMLAPPAEPMTPLARYTQANGLFYLALGLGLYAWPGAMGPIGAPDLVGQEAGLVQMLGMCVAIVGWFYAIGARTNQDKFGLATVADRLLVPAFVFPLIALGRVDAMLAGPVAVLDPILGIGAFFIWRSQQGSGPAPR